MPRHLLLASSGWEALKVRPGGVPSGQSTVTGVQTQAAFSMIFATPDFGNPFAAPWRETTWLTLNDGIVKCLAEAAYEQRVMPAGTLDPECLAVLADALEEAGADADLLNHLRGPGPHYRGCWAIDLLLGK
jgi:hypothetical protein